MIDYSDGFRGFESPHILLPFLTLIYSYRQYLGTYFIPITSEDKDVIEVVFPKKMMVLTKDIRSTLRGLTQINLPLSLVLEDIVF